MRVRIQVNEGNGWRDGCEREITERGARSVRVDDPEGYARTFSLVDGSIWHSGARLRVHPDDLPALRALPMRPIVLAKTKPADEIDLNTHPLAPLLRRIAWRADRSHNLEIHDPTTALDLIQAEVLCRGGEEPEILETCAAVAVMGLAAIDKRGEG